jgi:hypothetical protein
MALGFPGLWNLRYCQHFRIEEASLWLSRSHCGDHLAVAACKETARLNAHHLGDRANLLKKYGAKNTAELVRMVLS